MDDELQAELARTLAGHRNALDPASGRPPALFGSWVRDNLGSAYPREPFGWAKDNPELGRDISGKLGLLLMALRSSSGAGMGNAVAARGPAIAGSNPLSGSLAPHIRPASPVFAPELELYTPGAFRPANANLSTAQERRNAFGLLPGGRKD